MGVRPMGSRFVLPDFDDSGWMARLVRRRRKEIQLSQDQAVERIKKQSGLEISVATYSRCETGKKELENGGIYLTALARGLGCSTTYLLGLTEDPTNWKPEVDWPTEP